MDDATFQHIMAEFEESTRALWGADRLYRRAIVEANGNEWEKAGALIDEARARFDRASAMATQADADYQRERHRQGVTQGQGREARQVIERREAAYQAARRSYQKWERVREVGGTKIEERGTSGARNQRWKRRLLLGMAGASLLAALVLVGMHLQPSQDLNRPDAVGQPKGRSPDGQVERLPLGISHGEPHIQTFDGVEYEFMAAGEFWAVRSETGDMAVQTRQELIRDSVSVNIAVAMEVNGDRVGVYQRSDPALYINGEPTADPEEELELAGGGSVRGSGTRYVVTWPDGSEVTVDLFLDRAINLVSAPSADRRGELSGLFGNFDGDPSGDLVTRDGAVATDPPSEENWEDFYGVYAESWRVRPNESLFDPVPTQEPISTLVPPAMLISIEDLAEEQRAEAEAVCRAAGVTNPVLLANCILDVALTGIEELAEGAASIQDSLFAGVERTFRGPAGQIEIADIGLPAGSYLVKATVTEAPEGSCFFSTTSIRDEPDGTESTILFLGDVEPSNPVLAEVALDGGRYSINGYVDCDWRLAVAAS